MKGVWDRWDIPSWLLTAALWVISALVWDRVPEEMPTRWDADGSASATTSREFGLLIVPLVATVIAAGVSIAWSAVFLKQSERKLEIIRWVRRGLLAAAAVVHVAVIAAAIHGSLSSARVAVTAAGVLLLLAAYRIPGLIRRGVLRRKAGSSAARVVATNGIGTGMLATVGVGTVAAAGLSVAVQLTILLAGSVLAIALIAIYGRG